MSWTKNLKQSYMSLTFVIVRYKIMGEIAYYYTLFIYLDYQV